jgi:hypothetical protein
MRVLICGAFRSRLDKQLPRIVHLRGAVQKL